MLKRPFRFIAAAFCSTLVSSVLAWDHPGHMTTAAIAFAEIEQARPDLIDKIGVLMMKHPDPAPFWVAAGEAKGKERTRRMFIEGSRWPDDARWTIQDRPAWHSARWAIVTDDAPPEAKAIVEARGGKPTGQALEALALNAAVLANPESKPDERALALNWLMHILGDIHQPFHVSDLFSKQFPFGNLGGSAGFVADPMADSSVQLHLLWDSNFMCVADTGLKDDTMREIARPNNDTLYINCLLDLRKDPVILEMPTFDSKYVSQMVTGYDHYVNIPMATRLGDFSKSEKMLIYSARTEGYKGEPVEGVDRVFGATGDFVSTVFQVMPHGQRPETVRGHGRTDEVREGGHLVRVPGW